MKIARRTIRKSTPKNILRLSHLANSSRLIKQVGPPGQGPGSEASTFRENTDTEFGKKPIGTSAHPPVLDIRSD